jgi:methanogenic corrinoid protein MtbC1
MILKGVINIKEMSDFKLKTDSDLIELYYLCVYETDKQIWLEAQHKAFDEKISVGELIFRALREYITK